MAILEDKFRLTVNNIIDTILSTPLIGELQPRRNLLCQKYLTLKNICSNVSVGDAPHTTNV
jgi:hypothetical protein